MALSSGGSEWIRFRICRAPARAPLRELTGYDQRDVARPDTGTAIRLLDRVIERDAAPDEWTAAALTACDRDRALAALYRLTYGDRIVTTAFCGRCHQPFDVSFSLTDLESRLDAHAAGALAEPAPEGTFVTPTGSRFRLPTGHDELAVAAFPPETASQALMDRCLLSGDASGVEEAMEDVAPVFDLELQATCPECSSEQPTRFDVQYYLLTSLEQERVSLLHEVHRLASAYGWSLEDTLGLRRSERRRLVEMIEAELPGIRRTVR
jgi:hypothetical protein